ncbi:hypothetical protein BT93_C2414 [Corymbia citriodora subsp. variegata]|nr:hypothetical protein BT93_C2414 [Corymbia citriodora subsp. variegata]
MVKSAAVGDEAKSNILDNEKADFERVVNVNATDVFLENKHAAQALIPLQRGSIINVRSFSSSAGWFASHAYTSCDHAIMGLKRNVVTELGQRVQVHCLSPYSNPTLLSRDIFKIDGKGGFRVYSHLHWAALQKGHLTEAAL